MSHSTSLQLVLTSSPDGPIIAYDVVSGAAVSRFSGSRSPRNGLTLVGETSFAAAHICPATASGSIHVYNWWSSAAHHHLPLPEPAAPLAATLDGSHLFAGGVSGRIHVISLPSGDVIRSVTAHVKTVSCFGISSDGSLLVSGGEDGVVLVFPILLLVDATNKINTTSCCEIQAHSDSVTAVSFMGFSNSTMVSASLDCTCKIWSLFNGTPLKTVSFPCPISGVAPDPTKPEFFAAGSDGSIYLSGRAPKPAVWGENHRSAVVAVAVSGEGRTLLSASEDGEVWIWDTETEKVITIFSGEMGSVSDMVVAGGMRNARRWCGEEQIGIGFSGGGAMGVAAREMAEMAREAEKDEAGAIEMLESAIEMYEKLLEMILKEAQRGCGSNDGGED